MFPRGWFLMLSNLCWKLSSRVEWRSIWSVISFSEVWQLSWSLWLMLLSGDHSSIGSIVSWWWPCSNWSPKLCCTSVLYFSVEINLDSVACRRLWCVRALGIDPIVDFLRNLLLARSRGSVFSRHVWLSNRVGFWGRRAFSWRYFVFSCSVWW